MTLARRIVNALAALYAYAMAPDDYTPPHRRIVIDEGADAIDAANEVAWLEEWMIANPTAAVELQATREPDGATVFRVYLGGPLDRGRMGAGIVEAISAVRRVANQ